MSQKVIFTTLYNGEREVRLCEPPSVPDEEDIACLAVDHELYGCVKADYEWYEVGEGESDTDGFFSDEELAHMDATGDFIGTCESRGYICELIQTGSINVDVENEEE